jgi:DHA2 family multidrug resistance protein
VNSLRLQDRLHALIGVFTGRGSGLPLATQQATDMVAQQVRLNATVMAYSDAFWILGVCILLSLATLLILRKPQPGAAMAAAEAH